MPENVLKDNALHLIVVCWRRLGSLQRLLFSIEQSIDQAIHKNPNMRVDITVSVDGDGCDELIEFARNLIWHHGKIDVIVHQENMGTRLHMKKVLQSVALGRPSVILEDDLYVGEGFEAYSRQALEFYDGVTEVCGISLFSPNYSETARAKFTPLSNGQSVYFMKIPSSWGAAFTPNMAKEFLDWWSSVEEDKSFNWNGMPHDVFLWPDSSWKKVIYKYMAEKHKYFVYPYVSFTANFVDQGVNHHSSDWINLMVPIEFGDRKYSMASFQENRIVSYNEYWEYDGTYASELESKFGRKIEFDLYGFRGKDSFAQNSLVFTVKPVKKSILKFDRRLLPHEQNVFVSVLKSGAKLFQEFEKEQIKLAEVSDIIFDNWGEVELVDHISYHYQVPKFLIKEYSKHPEKIDLKNYFRNIIENGDFKNN